MEAYTDSLGFGAKHPPNYRLSVEMRASARFSTASRGDDAQAFGGLPGGRFDFLKKRFAGLAPGVASGRRACSGRRPCP